MFCNLFLGTIFSAFLFFGMCKEVLEVSCPIYSKEDHNEGKESIVFVGQGMMKQGPGVCLEFEHLDSRSKPACSAFHSHSLS